MLVFFNSLISTGPIREIRGPRANVCFGGPIFQKNCWQAVGEIFFHDIKKKGSKKFFQTNSCYNMGKTLFWISICKILLQKIFPRTIIYIKKRSKFFLFFGKFGAPLTLGDWGKLPPLPPPP